MVAHRPVLYKEIIHALRAGEGRRFVDLGPGQPPGDPVAQEGLLQGGHVGRQPIAGPAQVLVGFAPEGDLRLGFVERLPLLRCHQQGEIVPIGQDQLVPAAQDSGALLCRFGPPGRHCLGGRFDGQAGLTAEGAVEEQEVDAKPLVADTQATLSTDESEIAPKLEEERL